MIVINIEKTTPIDHNEEAPFLYMVRYFLILNRIANVQTILMIFSTE